MLQDSLLTCCAAGAAVWSADTADLSWPGLASLRYRKFMRAVPGVGLPAQTEYLKICTAPRAEQVLILHRASTSIFTEYCAPESLAAA